MRSLLLLLTLSACASGAVDGMDARRDARGDAGRDAQENMPDAPLGDTGPLPDIARLDVGTDVEEIPADCMDGLQNGSETDVDRGGACPRCTPGAGCAGFLDCLSLVCTGGVCVAPASRAVRERPDLRREQRLRVEHLHRRGPRHAGRDVRRLPRQAAVSQTDARKMRS